MFHEEKIIKKKKGFKDKFYSLATLYYFRLQMIWIRTSKKNVVWCSVNSLPNDKILDSTQLKAFADDKINSAHKTISVFDNVENIMGKRRKCWLPAFSPFPMMFSKSFSEPLKVETGWVKC